jgi:AAA15 family ATPase/GTPase
MIHYLKIRNFGPVREEIELDLEVADHVKNDPYEVEMADGRRLLKLAYIYGANASGKSTILKAFEFLRKILLRPVTNKAIEFDFEPFLLSEDPYSNNSGFEFSFYFDSIRYVYEITFNKQAILNEKIVFYQTAKPTELFTRSTDIEKRLAKIEFGSRIKVPVREKDLLESNILHNNTVIGAYFKTNVDIPELEKLSKWFNTFLFGMISSANNLTETTARLLAGNEDIKKWMNIFLNKADNQITEVTVSEDFINVPLDDAFPSDFSDRLMQPSGIEPAPELTMSLNNSPGIYYGGPMHRRIDFIHEVENGKNYVLSILDESSGTRRYFGLGGPLYMLIHNSCLLCIDELETSLHPDLMKYFLQVFLLNSQHSQLLITTHNFSLMDNSDFIRRDALWFTEKNETGAVELYAAADFDSSTLRKDASLINAYRSGKLGAKPNLGSPYLIKK